MKVFNIIILSLMTNLVFSQDFEKSIVRNDNDYVTYIDNESLKEFNPKKVKEMFKLKIKQIKGNTKRVKFYSYKININENIDIYALIVDCNFTNDCYIIAYDKFKQTITINPVKLNIKWANNNESGFKDKLLCFPLLDIQKADNKYTISIKERFHNGNTYNAVINKIYILKDDLSFDLKFCYEETALTFDGKNIKRVLNDNNIYVYKQGKSVLEYLGKIQIDVEAKKIIKKECVKDEFCEILFTCSGEDEENILKNGFEIKY